MNKSVLIRGGTVIDGTGAQPRTADVLIEDDVIADAFYIVRSTYSLVSRVDLRRQPIGSRT
jgi:N-acyl-D-aspartate/D-glutamate deacylase